MCHTAQPHSSEPMRQGHRLTEDSGPRGQRELEAWQECKQASQAQRPGLGLRTLPPGQ